MDAITIILILLAIVIIVAAVLLMKRRNSGRVLIAPPASSREGIDAVINALMRGHDLIGQPVVEIATGDDIAEVKDVVFDAGQGTITGFTLRKRGFFGRKLKDILTIDGVSSVGTHAVMIEDSEALVNRDEADGGTRIDAGGDVLNDMVITESGRTLGRVRDVIVVGGAQPRVVGFEIGGGSVGDGLIPVAAKTGVSGSALIVPDGYEQRVRTDLTGLAAELASIEGDRA